MAKGARASTKKANNVALKSRVFGPIESARTERLSAKLLELASQPKQKPVKEDVIMDAGEGMEEDSAVPVPESKQTEEMEVDQEALKSSNRPKSSKGRIEKRRHHRKASIVFPKYAKGKRVGKSKPKK